MHKIEKFLPGTISTDLILKITKLKQKVWPENHPPGKPDEVIIREYREKKKLSTCYLIRESGKVIASGEIFPRTIYANDDKIEVMALAAVCVQPERQGEGLGKKIVLEAFNLIRDGIYDVSLFQTDVPDFYKKLGARTVTNRFFNSKAVNNPDSNPWWGSDVMIYPSTYSWPQSDIDLNGSGY